MSKIVDTAISAAEPKEDSVSLGLSVDFVLSPAEVIAGRSGGSRFEMQCDIWDDDTFSDDWITRGRKAIAAESIATLVGVEFDFVLLLKDLRKKEAYQEHAIELYGEFTLLCNGSRVSSAKSKLVNVKLPAHVLPVLPPPIQRPRLVGAVSTAHVGTSSALIVNARVSGHLFKPMEPVRMTVVTAITQGSGSPTSSTQNYDVAADANGSFVRSVGVTINELQHVRFDIVATGPTSGKSNAIVASW